MTTLLSLVGWCILFVLCWPIALLALIVWPIVWLISIPLKLVGISIGAVLALAGNAASSGRHMASAAPRKIGALLARDVRLGADINF